jgi:TetR/AcrR family transcriptional regulator, cholesterol catabolism regulator
MANRRDQQKEATREHLFKVAMLLFEKNGYEQVNIDDIVRRSRVARGTFYFHYARKDDILLEAIRRGERHIVACMAKVGEGGNPTLRAALEACIAGFADVWQARRELLAHAGTVSLKRIAVVEQERDEDPLRIELARHVERALATGELRSALPGRMLADIFLLDLFVAAMAWASLGEPPLPFVMSAVIDLFLHGVGTLSTTPTS